MAAATLLDRQFLERLERLTIHWEKSFSGLVGGHNSSRFAGGGGRHCFPRLMFSRPRLEPAGHTSFYQTVRDFISNYQQRGLLVIISDFLDDEGCEKALQYLADFGHELLLIQVWSEEDRLPPWTGELELLDSESGNQVKLQIDERAREKYTAAFDSYAGALEKIAASNGGRY